MKYVLAVPQPFWQHFSHPTSPLLALNVMVLYKSPKWRGCPIVQVYAFLFVVRAAHFVLPLTSVYDGFYLFILEAFYFHCHWLERSVFYREVAMADIICYS